MQYQNIEIATAENGVARVSISRPKALNALNDQTIGEIAHCFGSLADDDNVRVVTITGVGEKAFVAGADIGELAAQTVGEAKQRSLAGQRAFSRIESLGKPVIAIINGFALGGGLELALACHLRFAADSARLGLPEVTLGIIPGYGGTQRLQRIVGRGRALQWILTGEMLRAQEAERIGLLNGVFAAGELTSAVDAVVTTLLSRGPLALKAALEAVLRGGDLPMVEALALEADLFALVTSTDDMREGMQAFLEKRSPKFKGC